MYELIFPLYFFILGIIIGSFLNVVIYRYNTGKGIGGRSFCMSCGKKLSWYELIPLFSYLIQLCRCRNCKSKISFQYPFVEFTTGILFVLVCLKYGISFYGFSWWFLYGLIQVSILMVIFIYDFKHKIIPNGFVYVFILLAFLQLLISNFILIKSFNFINLDFWSGPLMALPIFILWIMPIVIKRLGFKLEKDEWMGFGDVKLALGIGWFLGFAGSVYAFLIAFWSGAVIGLIMIGISRLDYVHKKVKIDSEIPFGPFLIFGLLAVWFSQDYIDLLLLSLY